MHISVDGLLLPNPHAELEAIPSRGDQEKGSIYASAEVLLESVDWNLWGLVYIRLCKQVKFWTVRKIH